MYWKELLGQVKALQAQGTLPDDFEIMGRSAEGVYDINELRIGTHLQDEEDPFIYDVTTQEEFDGLNAQEQASYEKLSEPVLLLDE